MHDILQNVAIVYADAASTGTVKAAVITAVSVIMAAGLAALAALRGKGGDSSSLEAITASERAWTSYNAELTRRAAAAEKEVGTLRVENERLRDVCWSLGQDPDIVVGGANDNPPAA